MIQKNELTESAIVQIGDKTYQTDNATIQKSNKEEALYSGYYCTFSGNIYDTNIASGMTGSVTTGIGTLVNSSCTITNGQAKVSGAFSLPQDTSFNSAGEITADATVTINEKTIQNLSFLRTMENIKKREILSLQKMAFFMWMQMEIHSIKMAPHS